MLKNKFLPYLTPILTYDIILWPKWRLFGHFWSIRTDIWPFDPVKFVFTHKKYIWDDSVVRVDNVEKKFCYSLPQFRHMTSFCGQNWACPFKNRTWGERTFFCHQGLSLKIVTRVWAWKYVSLGSRRECHQGLMCNVGCQQGLRMHVTRVCGAAWKLSPGFEPENMCHQGFIFSTCHQGSV